MSNVEYRSTKGIELRRDDEGKPTGLVGYAAVYGKWSVDMGFRERIAKGAFGKLDREGLDVRALVDHDPSKILGRNIAGTLALSSDDTGLRVDIDMPDTTTGRDTLASVERGDLDSMSFGFRTIDDKWWTEDGQERRELQSVELLDVSVVAFPAYPDTSVAVRSLTAWRKHEADDIAWRLGLAERRLSLAKAAGAGAAMMLLDERLDHGEPLRR